MGLPSGGEVMNSGVGWNAAGCEGVCLPTLQFVSYPFHVVGAVVVRDELVDGLLYWCVVCWLLAVVLLSWLLFDRLRRYPGS